jgi:hypothetical protein
LVPHSRQTCIERVFTLATLGVRCDVEA